MRSTNYPKEVDFDSHNLFISARNRFNKLKGMGLELILKEELKGQGYEPIHDENIDKLTKDYNKADQYPVRLPFKLIDHTLNEERAYELHDIFALHEFSDHYITLVIDGSLSPTHYICTKTITEEVDKGSFRQVNAHASPSSASLFTDKEPYCSIHNKKMEPVYQINTLDHYDYLLQQSRLAKDYQQGHNHKHFWVALTKKKVGLIKVVCDNILMSSQDLLLEVNRQKLINQKTKKRTKLDVVHYNKEKNAVMIYECKNYEVSKVNVKSLIQLINYIHEVLRKHFKIDTFRLVVAKSDCVTERAESILLDFFHSKGLRGFITPIEDIIDGSGHIAIAKTGDTRMSKKGDYYVTFLRGGCNELTLSIEEGVDVV